MNISALSVEKIRNLEQQAKALGLDERILIENASSNLFSLIEKLSLGKKVLVVAGRGNNGADVLSCARKLKGRGYEVEVCILSAKAPGPEVAFQRKILNELGVSVKSLDEENLDSLDNFIKSCDFVLEGIVGIGIKGELSPFLKEIISIINRSKKTVVSCDIPSGLSPDDGAVLGESIKATYTITFIAPKLGFLIGKGPSLCGRIFIVDIGISREDLEKTSTKEEK